MSHAVGEYSDGVRFALEHFTFVLDSIQQDKESVELELCSQIWWEERGWIMIPPDATIEGIDSLLKQVRKKLQQEPIEKDKEIEKLIVRDIMEATIARINKGKVDKEKEENIMMEKIKYLRNLGLKVK
jgi:hypothetical protein